MSAADGGCFKPQKIEQIDWSGHAPSNAHQAEIERLRKELADALDVKIKEGPTALSMALADRDMLRKELVESQARELKVRQALNAQPRNTRVVWKDGIDLDVADAATKLRDDALAIPADHSALDALLAKARAEERERIARAADGRPDDCLSLTADDIRALK